MSEDVDMQNANIPQKEEKKIDVNQNQNVENSGFNLLDQNKEKKKLFAVIRPKKGDEIMKDINEVSIPFSDVSKKEVEQKSLFFDNDLQDLIKQKKKKEKKKSNFDLIYEYGKKNGLDKLKEKLRKEGYSEAQTIFYSNVLSVSTYEKHISLSDLLSGRCFTYKYLIGNIGKSSSNIFTTDKLYWLDTIYKSLSSNNNELMNLLVMNSTKISLQTLLQSVEEDYKSGYVRDYTESFSYIVPGIENDEVEQALINKSFGAVNLNNKKIGQIQQPIEFQFNNIKYKSIEVTPVGIKIIFPADMPDDQVNELIKKTTVYNSKKNLKEGIKINKIGKKAQYLYISQDIVLTNFSPYVIYFTEPLYYFALCTFEFDMLKLEDYILSKIPESPKNIGEFIDIPNLVDWNNVNLFIDFLIIEAYTKLKDEKYAKAKDLIINFIDEWNKNKLNFNLAKEIILKVLDCFEMFFTSFSNKINMKKISDLGTKLMEVESKFRRTRESEKSPFQYINDLLYDNGLDKAFTVIFNATSAKALKLYTIFEELQRFVNGFIAANDELFLEKARTLGGMIFQLYILGNNLEQCINKIITPSIFLGGVIQGNTEIPMGMFDKVKSEYKENINVNENQVDELLNLEKIDPKEAFSHVVSSYLLYKLPQFDGYDFENDKIKQGSDYEKFLTNFIKEKKDVDPEMFNKLVIKGKLSLYEPRPILMEDFNEEEKKYLDEQVLNQYLIKIKKDDLNKEQENLNLQEEINKIRQKMERIRKGIIPPIDITKPVTTDAMERLNIVYLKEGDIMYPDRIDTYNILRNKGITDDVITDNYEWIEEELNNTGKLDEEAVKALQDTTNERWGPNGTNYMIVSKLKKENVEQRKKIREKKKKEKKDRKPGVFKKFLTSKKRTRTTRTVINQSINQPQEIDTREPPKSTAPGTVNEIKGEV